MAIDAVVTWVDGADPAHAAKVAEWLPRSRSGPKIISKAAIPHRFASHDEIIYCLRSIRTHAPWLRTIWLVTDDQYPAGIDRNIAEAHGIKLIDHRHVFRGLEELLPTFNSIAIETLSWRIEGLADQYILFNDDMFLAGPTDPDLFFSGDSVVLRGRAVDWTTREPSGYHELAQIRAANMMKRDLTQGFIEAHCPHPMLRPVMAELYRRFYLEFINNAALRFRTKTRFYPPALSNFYLMEQDRALIRTRHRTTFISAHQCDTGTPDFLRERLAKVEQQHVKMFCINGFGTMIQKVPEAEERLAGIVGPPQPWEITPAPAARSVVAG